jgi:predicted glycoside hydrolase/deacetylase ChbG (UPF0249 family)
MSDLPLRIILNADDFGFDDDTVRATIECFESGALTSATIMPKMPATAAAIDYARAHPQFSFGIHLTFVDEWPMSQPRDIPDLVDAQGRFLQSNLTRVKALRGRIDPAQIERELTAQLGFMRDTGLPISHVDSHGHLHKFKPFRDALKRVLPKFGIKRVRNSQDIYARPALLSPTYWMGYAWRRRIMETFETTDHLAMPMCDEGDRWMQKLLNAAKPGETMEVGVHPGSVDAERNRQRTGVQEFARFATGRGARLISWNQL